MENNYTEDIRAEQNGEPEPLYKDSALKGFLIFLYISAVNLISVAVSLGYWFLDHNHWTEYPSVFELFLLLCNFVFIVAYTVKCFRCSFYKQLKGIAFAFLTLAVGSLVISGIFFPILEAGYIICCFLTNSHQLENIAIVFIVNMVVLGIFAFVMIFYIYVGGEDDVPRKKPYLLSVRQITVLLSVFCVCFLAIYGFALAKYEFDYDFFGENLHSETPQDEYISSITSEQRALYAKIQGGDNIAETEKMLASNGFVNQEDYLNNYYVSYSIEDYFNYYFYLSDYETEYIFSQLKDSEFSFYFYTNEMKEVDYEWDDIVSCIIIAYDNSGKINYKMFIPSAGGENRYRNYSHGEETRKWFDNLQKGENTEVALEYIRGTDSFIIEDERYNGENSSDTFIIDFWCYHPLEATVTDFLFARSYAYSDYYYHFEIKSENSIITDFQELDEDN